MSPPGDDDPPGADRPRGTDDGTTDSAPDDEWRTTEEPDNPGNPEPIDQSSGNPGSSESTETTRQSPIGDSVADRPRPAQRDDSEAMDWYTFAYDLVSSAVAVLLVGAMLFAVSGVWPPMVAVESPSMTPHMKTGDLVFVMEEERFPGEGATGDTGVVTARTGETTDADYRRFQRQGDVIVYEPDGNDRSTPIIHRAMFWVEKNENWYEKADKQALGRYDECGEATDDALPNCPAPHAGFVTKGDANGRYDQVDQLSGPVKPEWVVGTAEVRIPKLGCVRLRTDGCLGGALGSPLGNGTAAPLENNTAAPLDNETAPRQENETANATRAAP